MTKNVIDIILVTLINRWKMDKNSVSQILWHLQNIWSHIFPRGANYFKFAFDNSMQIYYKI